MRGGRGALVAHGFEMKFVLRVCGTWLVGLALVLIVVDGAKTLAANALTMTSLAEMWRGIDAESWAAVSGTLMETAASATGRAMIEQVFAWPSWAIFGVAGVLLLILGRQRRRRDYIATR